MNKQSILKQLAGQIIEAFKIFLVIKPLQFAYKNSGYDSKLASMRKLPEGSAGYDLAHLLDSEKLRVIPKFEEHDLKHLILGYGMSPEEELRMQAFLFGNGNKSIWCILFLSSAVIMPSVWKTLKQDYQSGKNSPCILNLKLDECINDSTENLRNQFRIKNQITSSGKPLNTKVPYAINS